MEGFLSHAGEDEFLEKLSYMLQEFFIYVYPMANFVKVAIFFQLLTF